MVSEVRRVVVVWRGEVDSGRVAKGLLGNSNILFLGLGPGYIREFAL